MPLYQIDIEKTLGGEFWTNVYYVQQSDLSNANTDAGTIAGIEATFHLENVQFTKARIRTVAEGDEIFVTRPLGFIGARDNSGGQLLPLFNVVRVDIGAITGRPSRKYYRGTLLSSDVQANGTIVEAYRAFVEQQVDILLGSGLNGVPLRDVDGEELTVSTAFQTIGMRQLRRGSKRRLQPVLP